MKHADKKDALSPVTGKITTPDGSILQYHLYNGEKNNTTPAVLVCGLEMLQSDWKQVISQLAKKRPVLTFDNRGIGESSVANHSLITMDNMINDIQLLAQHLSWKSINLIGISMGGMISQSLAAKLPTDLVLDNLVLISSALKSTYAGPLAVPQWMEEMHNPPTETEWYQFIDKLFSACLTPEFIRDHPQKTKTFLDMIHAGKNRNFDTFIAQVATALVGHHDYTDTVKKITTPTLILHGAKDVGQLPQNGRGIHALIHGSKYMEYPNGGHMLYETNPEIIEEIDKFLTTH
ncbi:Alpha/Beta hydrolase protein [Gongronella butleri]|nr:Alpha/Beta hydrolase protein [Gongronella butleri]